MFPVLQTGGMRSAVTPMPGALTAMTDGDDQHFGGINFKSNHVRKPFYQGAAIVARQASSFVTWKSVRESFDGLDGGKNRLEEFFAQALAAILVPMNGPLQVGFRFWQRARLHEGRRSRSDWRIRFSTSDKSEGTEEPSR